MKSNIIYFSLATILILGTSSCEKRRLNRSTVTSQDNAIAEIAFNDVQSVTENGMKENDLEKSSYSLNDIYSSCATFTLTPAWPDSTFPKTLTIDFGTTNCTDNYGVNRRGKIIATATGKYRDAGSIFTITPDNYYVNDYKIEGTKTVTNNGQNSSGQTSFNINIDNAKITYPNGDVITYESDRVRTWVIGENTQGLLGIWDDEYDITGSASGVNREGRNFTVNITSALRAAVACHYIKQGTMDIQPEDLYLRTVDFGDGTCDAQATVTINGNTYNFTMH